MNQFLTVWLYHVFFMRQFTPPLEVGRDYGKYHLAFDAPTIVFDAVTGKPLALNTAHASTEHPAMLHTVAIGKSAGQRFLGIGNGGGVAANAAAAKERRREARHKRRRDAMLAKSGPRERPWASSTTPNARDIANAADDPTKLAAWLRRHGANPSRSIAAERRTNTAAASAAAAKRRSERRLVGSASRVLRGDGSARRDRSRRASAAAAAASAAAALAARDDDLGHALGVSIPLMPPPLFVPKNVTAKEAARLPRKLAAIKASHIGELQNALHEELELERRRNLRMSQCKDKMKLAFLRKENVRLRKVAKKRVRDIELDNELCLAATLVHFGYIR